MQVSGIVWKRHEEHLRPWFVITPSYLQPDGATGPPNHSPPALLGSQSLTRSIESGGQAIPIQVLSLVGQAVPFDQLVLMTWCFLHQWINHCLLDCMFVSTFSPLSEQTPYPVDGARRFPVRKRKKTRRLIEQKTCAFSSEWLNDKVSLWTQKMYNIIQLSCSYC